MRRKHHELFKIRGLSCHMVSACARKKIEVEGFEDLSNTSTVLQTKKCHTL